MSIKKFLCCFLDCFLQARRATFTLALSYILTGYSSTLWAHDVLSHQRYIIQVDDEGLVVLVQKTFKQPNLARRAAAAVHKKIAGDLNAFCVLPADIRVPLKLDKMRSKYRLNKSGQYLGLFYFEPIFAIDKDELKKKALPCLFLGDSLDTVSFVFGLYSEGTSGSALVHVSANGLPPWRHKGLGHVAAGEHLFYFWLQSEAKN